jgi:hypothetical protein
MEFEGESSWEVHNDDSDTAHVVALLTLVKVKQSPANLCDIYHHI